MCENNFIKTLVTLLFALILLGCTKPGLDELVSSINNKILINIYYEIGDNVYICKPEESQKLLLQWVATLKIAGIASWADADEHISLNFNDGSSYRIRVTFNPNIDYTTILMEELYIGEPINLAKVCGT